MHGATFTILKILYVVIYKRWNGTLFLFYSPWWWDVRCDWRVWIFMISSQTTRALVVSSQRFYNDLKLIWKKKNRHHPNIYRWPDSNRMKTVKNITMLERKAPHPPQVRPRAYETSQDYHILHNLLTLKEMILIFVLSLSKWPYLMIWKI